MTIIYYFTRWLETMPCRNANQEAVIEMIKRIITHFGIPQTVVLDNGLTFIKANLLKFITKYGIY